MQHGSQQYEPICLEPLKHAPKWEGVVGPVQSSGQRRLVLLPMPPQPSLICNPLPQAQEGAHQSGRAWSALSSRPPAPAGSAARAAAAAAGPPAARTLWVRIPTARRPAAARCTWNNHKGLGGTGIRLKLLELFPWQVSCQPELDLCAARSVCRALSCESAPPGVPQPLRAGY